MGRMKKLEAQRALKAILAFGADNDDDEDEDDAPRPKPGDRRRNRNQSRRAEDDDDEDDSFHRGGKFGHIANEKDRRIAELTDENAKRRIQNRDLREENEELQASLKRATKLQPKLDDLQKKYDDLEKASKISAIRNAIANGEQKYHDLEMVLGLLNQEELAVDLSDGTIGGLEDQLNKIAEDRPFLVKAGESKEGEGDDKDKSKSNAQQSNQNQNQNPSGYTPQSSASGARNQQVAEEELKKKMVGDFPALANLL